MKKGVFIQIFVNHFQKHENMLLYEWLLKKAKTLGIAGGSAFRSIAGFGDHQVMHAEHFYELSSDVAVMVCFAVSEEEASKLFNTLSEEKIKLLWTSYPMEFTALG